MFKEEAGHILFKPPALLDVAVEVAARAEFDHEANVFACLESVEQADYVRLVALLKNAHLEPRPSALVNFALQRFLAHALDSHQLFTQFVHGQ